MNKTVLYILIIVFSNTIGAISGMGGGVIIKPVLDAFSGDPLIAINFYSSFAVFIMSIVSTFKNAKKDIEINWWEILYLSMGSLIGGKFGDWIFMYLKTLLKSDNILNLVQIIIVIISLILALIYTKSSGWKFSNKKKNVLFLLSGVFLGTSSTFLGIGGGPINVALLIFIFNFGAKRAAIYSIASIFFSQFMKLVSLTTSLTKLPIDLKLLPFILIAAVLGGYLGSTISNKVSNKFVLILYKIVVIFVIGLNFYNGVTILNKL
ncbi:sulfite exporter TauE/SafE family protein [Lactobacillus halodurans]|uniref:Probable membrane transporter protein n=1 Tax=Companilactobacillus halodurans TaxID=2584183 RepID=A0A5P0ZQI3_9LACO|nr:sulfite exporter TauE/SafE family protein [Companilactobacillus halodurans]MQS76466.1 sulfite exporter TauE/SafE family protein [Companilactobacillus halodurans]